MLCRKSASQAGSYASPWRGFGGASTVYPSACRRWMTPSQLALLAHAPCTSTMVGLGPPPASAVPADAIWLSGMTKPAMATITAAIMSRSLPGRVIRAVFTEVSFPGVPSVRADARLCAARGSAALTDLRVDGSEGLRLAVQAFADWAESHSAPGLTRCG